MQALLLTSEYELTLFQFQREQTTLETQITELKTKIKQSNLNIKTFLANSTSDYLQFQKSNFGYIEQLKKGVLKYKCNF